MPKRRLIYTVIKHLSGTFSPLLVSLEDATQLLQYILALFYYLLSFLSCVNVQQCIC